MREHLFFKQHQHIHRYKHWEEKTSIYRVMSFHLTYDTEGGVCVCVCEVSSSKHQITLPPEEATSDFLGEAQASR
jgi:hypothetical protein